MAFFAHNSWMGSKSRYITRPGFTGKKQWIVRIGKNASGSVNKTFNDGDYGGKSLAFVAAQSFRDDALKRLGKRTKAHLRDGLPKYKKDAGIMMTVQRTRYGKEATYYSARCLNKYTGKLLSKSFAYGNNRTKEEAYALAQRWRLKMVEDVCEMGKNLGIVKI